MKFLIITTGALPIPAVVGGAVENLIEMIINENEKTYKDKLIIYSIENNEARKKSELYNNCEIRYINMNSKFDKIIKIIRYFINRIFKIYIGNLYITKVIKDINSRDETYDAIIIENSPEYALKLRKYYDGRLILHLHNDSLNSSSKLNKEIYESYDEIFAISNYLKKRLDAINGKIKTTILYNGIDLNKFKKKNNKRDYILKKYNIKEDSIVLMYSGRIVKEKGVKELIEAVLMLPKHLNIKLLVVGGNGYGKSNNSLYVNEIYKLAKKNSDRIIITGFIKYSDIPDLYSIADIGVIPSLCNDAFNLTTVEFIANGVPVIISNKGGMKEIINKKCGIIVDCDNNFVTNLSNSIMKLCINKNLKEMMSIEAFNQSRKFSKNNYTNKFNYLLKHK